MTGGEFNQLLAKSCRSCHASCCKKGKIFLSRSEHEALLVFLQTREAEALAAYQARVRDHGDFLLYDQESRCQFLDESELCRLHPLGLKPAECFWWPYHVFLDDAGALEVRVSTQCCDAHEAHEADSPYPGLIARKVAELGPEKFLAFRRVFPGETKGRSVGKVTDLLGAEAPLAPASEGAPL